MLRVFFKNMQQDNPILVNHKQSPTNIADLIQATVLWSERRSLSRQKWPWKEYRLTFSEFEEEFRSIFLVYYFILGIDMYIHKNLLTL